MKRLIFVSPDIEHTRKAVAALKDNGVPEKHIYALANDNTDIEYLIRALDPEIRVEGIEPRAHLIP
jgi:hypothetical protein